MEISPAAPLFRHKHAGEQIMYVLEGSLESHIGSQAPISVSAGDALMAPAETVHAVRNIGIGDAVLARYIVEEGKPLLAGVEWASRTPRPKTAEPSRRPRN